MKWEKLSDMSDDEIIGQGAVFRFSAKWPFDAIQDFMYVNNYKEINGDKRSVLLVCSSGAKSGHSEIYLPSVAESKNPKGISSGWLKRNWCEWVYPECPVNDVYVSRGYPAPDAMPCLS